MFRVQGAVDDDEYNPGHEKNDGGDELQTLNPKP